MFRSLGDISPFAASLARTSAVRQNEIQRAATAPPKAALTSATVQDPTVQAAVTQKSTSGMDAVRAGNDTMCRSLVMQSPALISALQQSGVSVEDAIRMCASSPVSFRADLEARGLLETEGAANKWWWIGGAAVVAAVLIVWKLR